VRLRLPRPRFGGGHHRLLLFGTTPETLLRGLAKTVAIIAAAAVVGLLVGLALAKVSGAGDGSTDSLSGDSATTSASKTTTTPSAGKQPASPPSRQLGDDVRLRLVSAILHPAVSLFGRSRHRARLSVHVRVTNRASHPVVPARPVLVSGDIRVKTDAKQDSAATNLGALGPGATKDVTLRFETTGAVTQRLRQELRVRLIVAGKNVSAAVKPGSPANSRTVR
jgi:hypothetical protein